MSNDTFVETILFFDQCKLPINPDSISIYYKKGNYDSQFYASFAKYPMNIIKDSTNSNIIHMFLKA